MKYLIKSYQDVFGGNATKQQAQLVLFDLINKCEIFTVNTKDSHAAAVLSGRRYIGVYLLSMIGLAPQFGEPFRPEQLSDILDRAESAYKLHQTKTQTKKEDDI